MALITTGQGIGTFLILKLASLIHGSFCQICLHVRPKNSITSYDESWGEYSGFL